MVYLTMFFRQFSVITVKFDSGDNDEEENGEGEKEEKAETKVKRVKPTRV